MSNIPDNVVIEDISPEETDPNSAIQFHKQIEFYVRNWDRVAITKSNKKFFNMKTSRDELLDIISETGRQCTFAQNTYDLSSFTITPVAITTPSNLSMSNNQPAARPNNAILQKMIQQRDASSRSIHTSSISTTPR